MNIPYLIAELSAQFFQNLSLAQRTTVSYSFALFIVIHNSIKCVLFDFFSSHIARDVLNALIAAQVKDIDNFNWMSQLRYYWKYDDIGR